MTITGLCFNNVVLHQIGTAARQNDAAALTSARRALYWVTLAFAATLFWVLRRVLAQLVLVDATLSAEVGWDHRVFTQLGVLLLAGAC